MSQTSSGEQGPGVGPQYQPNPTAGITGSTAMVETIGGAAAIVLSILGLAGMFPLYMAAIATIAVAAALTLQGLAVSTCYSHLVHESGGRHPVADIRTGLTAEFIAGAVGVVLGVLSLLGLDAATLTAVAVIVLGTGLLLGAGLHNRLAHFAGQGFQSHPMLHHMTADVVAATAGAEVMVGGGAIVLGVISLVGTGSITLVLVGLLALGGSTLMTSAAMAGKMGTIWSQPHHHQG
jgi:hypothetical protein